MYDSLHELVSSLLLSETQVFALLDEYSVYANYLGFPVELRKPLSSPLREDAKPSFSLFEARGSTSIFEYRWKDSALNVSGDVVELVRRLYSLPTRDAALLQIDQDFELGLSNQQPSKKHHVYQKPPNKNASQILVHSCPFSIQGTTYWESYGVSMDILRRYDVKQISGFWTQPQQETPFTLKGLCFSYEINGYYKIYQPFNPDYKFINNYPSNYVEGYLQLPEKGETCIITKSTKDSMVLYSFGYAACSPRSESTPFPQHLLDKLSTRFSRIVTFFDNDILKAQNWGKLASLKYPFPSIFIPDEYAKNNIKDISDFRQAMGEQRTKELLTQLLT